MSKKQRELIELCKTIQESHEKNPKPPTLAMLSKLTKKPVSTISYWRKKLRDNGYIGSECVRGVNIPYYLFDRSLFEEEEIIKAFIEELKVDKKDPKRYINPLFMICKTLNVHPSELVKDDPSLPGYEKNKESAIRRNTEYLFSQFEEKWEQKNPGKTIERHAKALRKLCHYHNIDLKGSTAVPGGSESRGDYATVHLSDDEFTKGYRFFKNNADFLHLACFAFWHEFFPRPESLFSWIPQVDTQYVDVNGKTYEYGSCIVYENKQKKKYDKLILDPRVLKIAYEFKPDKPLVPKDHRDEMEHSMSEALRELYFELGKIDRKTVETALEKREAPYSKGEPGWLYYNRPIYTLRHSAATMWMRRLNFNADLVATMGWEDSKTLTKFYARTTKANIMDAGECYFCKPPQRTTDKAVFCGAQHATAFLNIAHGGVS